MYRILHLSLLLFFITSPLKSATFKIEKFTFQESNNLQWEIYREKSSKLSLSEVKNTSASEWTTKSYNEILVPGENEGAIWLRTDIVNLLPSEIESFINVQTLFLNDMSFYIFDENSKLLQSSSFNNNFSENSKLFLPEKTFSIKLQPKEKKTLLIRLRYNFTKKLALKIQTESKAVEEITLPYLLKGIFLGVLFLLTLITFIYAWINQQMSYISLSLFQFFMTFFASKTFGISIATILTDGAWWKGSGVFFNLSMCLVSISWFWIHLDAEINKRNVTRVFVSRLVCMTQFFIVPTYLSLAQKDVFSITVANLTIVSIWGAERFTKCLKGNKRDLLFYLAPTFNLITILISVILVRHNILMVQQFPIIVAISLMISFMAIFINLSYKITRIIESFPIKRSIFNDTAISEKTLERLESENAVLRKQVLDNVKLASVGKVAESLSHEISNPISIISAYNYRLNNMFRTKNFDIQFISKSLQKMDGSIHRITKVINALKVYGEEDSMGNYFDVINLKDPLAYSLSLYHEKFFSHGITVKNRIPENENLFTKGNLSDIMQVILNIMDNAVQAMSRSSSKEVIFEAEVTSEHVELKISNTGFKIPLDIQAQIFSPFFTTLQEKDHKGLGLSLAAHIMHKHNGKIMLADDAKYTCFILRFPRK